LKQPLAEFIGLMVLTPADAETRKLLGKMLRVQAEII
jgi:hypothetical protein